ncbi:hypothetical protein BC829DRAFT_414248 [Chytridium lagenaria]|nr:hypothetical protein BC829DRAFT_414248 [Chytridium lagenaria]
MALPSDGKAVTSRDEEEDEELGEGKHSEMILSEPTTRDAKNVFDLENRIVELELSIEHLTRSLAALQHQDTVPSSPKRATATSTLWYIFSIPWNVLRQQISKTVKENIGRGIRHLLLFLYFRRFRKWAMRTITGMILRLKTIEDTIANGSAPMAVWWWMVIVGLEMTRRLLE